MTLKNLKLKNINFFKKNLEKNGKSKFLEYIQFLENLKFS